MLFLAPLEVDACYQLKHLICLQWCWEQSDWCAGCAVKGRGKGKILFLIMELEYCDQADCVSLDVDSDT